MGTRTVARSMSHTFAMVALLHLVFCMKICSATRANPHSNTNTNAQFIKKSCAMTKYPRLCYESLSSHASYIQTSPWQLAHAALSVSLSGAQSTAAAISRLSAEHGLKPGEAVAMKDCIENLADSVAEIKKSAGEMGQLRGPEFGVHLSNMQTWLSAALTDDDTCLDGFEGKAVNGKIKAAVRSQITHAAHLTSNSLALVNNLASIQSKSP